MLVKSAHAELACARASAMTTRFFSAMSFDEGDSITEIHSCFDVRGECGKSNLCLASNGLAKKLYLQEKKMQSAMEGNDLLGDLSKGISLYVMLLQESHF